jgi:glycosyltransferase involved in cell wall biosynthesis
MAGKFQANGSGGGSVSWTCSRFSERLLLMSMNAECISFIGDCFPSAERDWRLMIQVAVACMDRNHVLENEAQSVKNTIIIPAYNEEKGLPVVLDKIFKTIDDSFEVLVVDDGSTDNTVRLAQQFPYRIVSHISNGGKGEAMMTGIREARGENVIFIDADGTYPAETISDIAAYLTEYDYVVASRCRGKQNMPVFNRIGNAIFSSSIRYLFGFKADDPLTGMYGLRKNLLKNMDLESRGFGIEAEISIKAGVMGLRVKELQIEYGERIGEAKLDGLRDGFRIGCTIIKYLPYIARRFLTQRRLDSLRQLDRYL